jgi:hypothetical protein
MAVIAGVLAAVIMLRANGFPTPNGEYEIASSGAFPDIAIEDVDGTTYSISALRGKPTLVWFSDSTCPDVDGVGRVARLDEETGGDALQILVVMIDQRAPGPLLAAWRDAFGRPDWMIAPDREGVVSAAAGVRRPETKFLLDERTMIVDQTGSLVDDAYLNLLRQRAHA